MAYERKDRFYRLAKKTGYRSRAAYKLLELSRRYRLIRRGDRVVDLGAWPGGWLQVAAELAGSDGRVIGVDIVPIPAISAPAVTCLCGDVRDPSIQQQIARLSGGKVDIVLSDMAPKLTGIRATDAVRSVELAELACRIAAGLLRPKGRLLVKMFAGPETETLIASLQTSYTAVRRTRPEASRARSDEFYVVALDYKAL